MSRLGFSLWLGSFAVLCLGMVEPALGQMPKSFGMKGGMPMPGTFAQASSFAQAGGYARAGGFARAGSFPHVP